MSNLCKQYVENELNCYKKKLYDITNEIQKKTGQKIYFIH